MFQKKCSFIKIYRMNYIKKIAIFCICWVGLTSCRYEDGPFISFYTPSQRLINTWSLQKVYRNGERIYAPEWQANQIGTFYAFHAYGPLVVTTYHNGMLRESYTGSWEFKNNEKEIDISFTLLDISYHYLAKIKKLSRTELIYEYTDSNAVPWRLEMYAQSN